jgi:hypothetical protein
MNWATTADSTNHQNPYARLSNLEPDDPEAEPIASEPWWDKLVWKSKTDVYKSVASLLAIPQLRTRPTPPLKQFAEVVIGLRLNSQRALHQRILSYFPDPQIVHNRLSPSDLDQVLIKLLGMADDAKALDAEAK